MKLSRRDGLRLGLAASASALLPVRAGAAPAPKPPALTGRWGDQGDGTFVNPVVPADYADIDVIQVGEIYYAISSTEHVAPGMVVMTSHDLVNWTTIGHAVPDIGAIGPEVSWRTMGGYGRGVWAGAIRFHDGRFWVYFACPDSGVFMTTATDAAGPWAPLTEILASPGFDDTCPFWDDDGQAYLVMSHFTTDPATGRSYDIHLFRMSPDGKSLDMASDRIIHQSPGSEANKLYKINGLYYHYYSESKREGRVAMMDRAASLEGPWETRQLNHVDPRTDKEPNQGGLVKAPSGDWWFLTHQGTGDWEGRALCLLPVHWIDGWPIIGAPGEDGFGNMVWQTKKPIAGNAATVPKLSDDFSDSALRSQWEWNHTPRREMWSLTERRGCLRLHAFQPVKPGDFTTAGNTLSQRAWRTRANAVTVQLDIGGMADGQTAGLSHDSHTFALLSLIQTDGVRRLEYRDSNQVIVPGPVAHARTILLRSIWDVNGRSQFSYSLDGRIFTDIGPIYQLAWGYYRGDRIGVHSYNDAAEAGYVDVMKFHYDVTGQTGA